MLIYCLFFLLLAVLAVEYEIRPIPKTHFILILIAVLLSLFAGLRGVSVSRDYEPYLGSFNAILHGGASSGLGILPLFEPAFVWIVKICFFLFTPNGAPAVMLVFAFLSMIPKTIAIHRLSFNPFLVLLLYYCHFFFFQEMTQIRNGMACSLFLLALLSYLHARYWETILYIAVAVLFHNSALLYLLLFLIATRRPQFLLYAALLGGGIILGILKLPILSSLVGFDLNLVSNKLTTYVDLADKGYMEAIRFFNVLNTLNVLITGYLLGYAFWYKITEPRFLLFLKSNIIALFIYGLLIDVPSMAARFSELYGATFPFLFAYGARYLPFKKFNIWAVILLAVVFFYINLFYGKLINPYSIYEFR
jgi:hypothetical protein